ncbi:aminotransferase-like domain-containing protein [Bacillus sp. Marseille-P3800]|uniref:aminotransferase-like domain-containing protein n=1 Tax=Bacillus sp. Marseille-P3800 TaxID=2014782 RepID=UPI000C08791D|nr:PLP-dependent aminotransferase family protein [Bacillus sp. Marseille-P3800]
MGWKPKRMEGRSLTLQIKEWMLEQITEGHWSIGMRLPSQRKLASELDVNRSTIIHVLEDLKADGVLEAKQGSGIYVKARGWEYTLSQHMPDWHKRMKHSTYKANIDTVQQINEFEQDETIIRLGTGELSPDLIPTEALLSSMKSLTMTNKDFGYSEPLGSLTLRNVLTEYLQKRGIHTNAKNIVIVSGGLQALQLISIGLLQLGSTIGYDSPSYLHSLPSIPTRSVYHEPKRQKKHSIYYTIPTLSNPTGRILSCQQRQSLLQSYHDRHTPIIEDDVYHELTFADAPPALKSFDRSGQVLYIGSVSKVLSPGLRVGWLVGPQSVIAHLADLKMQLDYGSSTLSQQVVAQWLLSKRFETHTNLLREELKARALFTEAILLRDFASIATWESSKGGFYIWLRIKQPVVTKSLFLTMLKRKILIHPGYMYKPNDYHHIRISYSYCHKEELEKALMILAEEITTRIV